MAEKHGMSRRECLQWWVAGITGTGLLGVYGASIVPTSAAPMEQPYPSPSPVATLWPTPYPPAVTPAGRFQIAYRSISPSIVQVGQNVTTDVKLRWIGPSSTSQISVVVVVAVVDTTHAIHTSTYTHQVFTHEEVKRYPDVWAMPDIPVQGYHMLMVSVYGPDAPPPIADLPRLYEARSLGWIWAYDPTPAD